jgi:outer membrane immunogenic protein
MPVKTMPVKAPVVAPYNWTGWYAGLNAGYSWGNSNSDASFATFPGGVPIVAPAGSNTSASSKLTGAIAGLQGGYNWQNGSWVVGLEGDIQWSGQKGTSDFLCAAVAPAGGPCLPGFTFIPAGVTGASLSLDQKLQWFGTLRGRVGILPTPTWLLYATGGLAVGGIKTDATLTGHTNAVASVPLVSTASSSTSKAGWTIGVGVEGFIMGDWTGKIEYLYVDYGSVSGNVTNLPAGFQASWSSHITDNIVRVGVNKHF